jgi:hypothetical protein
MSKRRVVKAQRLFVIAGSKKNAQPDSPTKRLVESGALANLDRVDILAPEGDAEAQDCARALVRMLNRPEEGAARGGREGREHLARIVSVPEYAGGHHARSGAREAYAQVVDKLLGDSLRGRLDYIEIVVSGLTGSPAQWSALLDAFEEHGVVPRLVYGGEGRGADAYRFLEARAVDAEPSSPVERHRRKTLNQHLELLANVPDSGVVLVTGETGAGKSRFARLLHERWYGPSHERFRAVDCGALPDALVDGELFGGANGGGRGAFDEADGGTLFLDDVGSIGERVQAKLLSALDVDALGRRHYRQVGGVRREARLRLILGTNRELLDYVATHRFRLDLLARISTHEVLLPPLRETPQRIPGAYLDELERLSQAYTRTLATREADRPSGRARASRVVFVVPNATFELLFDFVRRGERWWWPWNYRDVEQSAQRLALAAWDPDKIHPLTGHLPVGEHLLREELAFLEDRWNALRSDDEGTGRWADLETHYGRDQLAKWSVPERYEVRAARRASELHPDNAAEAYRAFWRAMNPDLPSKHVANPSSLWRQILKRLDLPT